MNWKQLTGTAVAAVVGFVAVDGIQFLMAKRRNRNKHTGLFWHTATHKITLPAQEAVVNAADMTGCYSIGTTLDGKTQYWCPGTNEIKIL